MITIRVIVTLKLFVIIIIIITIIITILLLVQLSSSLLSLLFHMNEIRVKMSDVQMITWKSFPCCGHLESGGQKLSLIIKIASNDNNIIP